jgi:DNA-binding transcriptional ArsR family regulator
MNKLHPQYQEFFKTLGNETRVQILLTLNKDGDCNVSELTQKLKVDQSTVSHNLKRLEVCKFVTVKPNGKERVYQLNEKTIKPLFALIKKHAETYCQRLCCK